MLGDILLPDPDHMQLEEIVLEYPKLELVVSAKSTTAACPSCGTLSSRIHSRYQRSLADLPCAGWSMRLLWNVRRFFCDPPKCLRVTYAEQLASVAGR